MVVQSALAASKALSGPRPADLGKVWADVLQTVPLFEGVPKRHVRKIAKLAREARFHQGSTIVRAGERGESFFVVIDGKASVLPPGGKRPVRIGPGSYFGEMSLIDGGVRSATVVADTEMLCLRLSRTMLMKMLRSEPEISIAMLRELARRLREAEKPGGAG
jgi:CRP-like cAMP-binding protein